MRKTAAVTDHIGYVLKVRDWACLGLTICCLLGLPVMLAQEMADIPGYMEGYEAPFSHEHYHSTTEETVVRLGLLNERSNLKTHTSNFYLPPQLHKNGRLVDPATYVHHTIRRSLTA